MNFAKSFRTGRLGSILALLVAFLVCFAAARLGSSVTTPNLDWYAGLAKPSFNPPNLAFPIVWTLLYAMMAIALWRVVEASGGWIAGNRTLIPFAIQLILNVAWSFVFFGGRDPAGGMVVILLLLGAIVWTILAFARKDRIAAALLLPYIVWVCFAAVLNAAILRLNP